MLGVLEGEAIGDKGGTQRRTSASAMFAVTTETIFDDPSPLPHVPFLLRFGHASLSIHPLLC